MWRARIEYIKEHPDEVSTPLQTPPPLDDLNPSIDIASLARRLQRLNDVTTKAGDVGNGGARGDVTQEDMVVDEEPEDGERLEEINGAPPTDSTSNSNTPLTILPSSCSVPPITLQQSSNLAVTNPQAHHNPQPLISSSFTLPNTATARRDYPAPKRVRWDLSDRVATPSAQPAKAAPVVSILRGARIKGNDDELGSSSYPSGSSHHTRTEEAVVSSSIAKTQLNKSSSTQVRPQATIVTGPASNAQAGPLRISTTAPSGSVSFPTLAHAKSTIHIDAHYVHSLGLAAQIEAQTSRASRKQKDHKNLVIYGNSHSTPPTMFEILRMTVKEYGTQATAKALVDARELVWQAQYAGGTFSLKIQLRTKLVQGLETYLRRIKFWEYPALPWDMVAKELWNRQQDQQRRKENKLKIFSPQVLASAWFMSMVETNGGTPHLPHPAIGRQLHRYIWRLECEAVGRAVVALYNRVGGEVEVHVKKGAATAAKNAPAVPDKTTSSTAKPATSDSALPDKLTSASTKLVAPASSDKPTSDKFTFDKSTAEKATSGKPTCDKATAASSAPTKPADRAKPPPATAAPTMPVSRDEFPAEMFETWAYLEDDDLPITFDISSGCAAAHGLDDPCDIAEAWAGEPTTPPDENGYPVFYLPPNPYHSAHGVSRKRRLLPIRSDSSSEEAEEADQGGASAGHAGVQGGLAGEKTTEQRRPEPDTDDFHELTPSEILTFDQVVSIPPPQSMTRPIPVHPYTGMPFDLTTYAPGPPGLTHIRAYHFYEQIRNRVQKSYGGTAMFDVWRKFFRKAPSLGWLARTYFEVRETMIIRDFAAAPLDNDLMQFLVEHYTRILDQLNCDCLNLVRIDTPPLTRLILIPEVDARVPKDHPFFTTIPRDGHSIVLPGWPSDDVEQKLQCIEFEILNGVGKAIENANKQDKPEDYDAQDVLDIIANFIFVPPPQPLIFNLAASFPIDDKAVQKQLSIVLGRPIEIKHSYTMRFLWEKILRIAGSPGFAAIIYLAARGAVFTRDFRRDNVRIDTEDKMRLVQATEQCLTDFDDLDDSVMPMRQAFHATMTDVSNSLLKTQFIRVLLGTSTIPNIPVDQAEQKRVELEFKVLYLTLHLALIHSDKSVSRYDKTQSMQAVLSRVAGCRVDHLESDHPFRLLRNNAGAVTLSTGRRLERKDSGDVMPVMPVKVGGRTWGPIDESLEFD
ncbi:uncharacterized protein I303_101456 [Kwoniella dejecticola CBS 10117]|uniref:Uncharacterized protein n=1 Tax=Kwoniella dejecticola CBS 10117 TaxID=1296121 RepID=A0A1A6AHW2_9TREE|nr:uncharacterized protein I303_01465 [Kwoniella dejecticola CBS 10117]OBR89636.1 hypothetical protein I303_01465 [Kwoniella dejecticola CBS 10117]